MLIIWNKKINIKLKNLLKVVSFKMIIRIYMRRRKLGLVRVRGRGRRMGRWLLKRKLKIRRNLNRIIIRRLRSFLELRKIWKKEKFLISTIMLTTCFIGWTTNGHHSQSISYIETAHFPQNASLSKRWQNTHTKYTQCKVLQTIPNKIAYI